MKVGTLELTAEHEGADHGVVTPTVGLVQGNRLLGDNEFTYGYDANGNLTSKTEILTLDVTTYSYDGENRLVRNWVSAKSYGNAPRHYPRTT